MRVDEGVRARVRAVLGGVAVATLVLGSLTTPARAADPAPVECPGILPKSAITEGLVGQGETVVKGTTPEPFNVEVLGTLTDGYAPGHDIIMVKLSDLPGYSVISQAGGGWAGISGSPVYVDGKLLGSVSFGFTLAPSPLAGVTPAADMADLLSRPSTSRAAKSATTLRKVSVSAAKLRSFAKEAGVAAPSGSLEPFPTPFAVSGLNGAGLKRFRSDFAATGKSSVVVASGRAAAPAAGSAPEARPVAGGNFVDVVSYGDLSLTGTGTTTYVCNNQALAFGHPMDLAGATSYGASGASAITIVKDDTLGSYKLTNVGPSYGTVDQDRLSGIRGDLTKVPTTVPITTYIVNDDNGKARTGVTQVAARDYVTAASFYAPLVNYETTFDEYGSGRASGVWSISGTRANGRPFYVARADKYADLYDPTYQPSADVADAVDALLTGSSEKVTITAVTFKSAIGTDYKALNLRKVEVSVNGGAYKAVSSLKLKVGDKLAVRSSVTPYESTRPTVSVSRLTVPKSVRGTSAVLSVVGGETTADYGDYSDGDTSCYLDPTGCDDLAPTSLDTVIKGLTSAPRRDDLVVSLTRYSDTGSTVVASKVTTRQAEVISGSKRIRVSVSR